MRELGEPVPGDDEPKAKARIGQRQVAPLVDEGEVDPAGRLDLLGGLDQPVPVELHPPRSDLCLGLRTGLRLRQVPRPGVVLGQALAEPVRGTGRGEAYLDLLDLALREAPDAPLVGLVRPGVHQLLERAASSTLQLDVRLDLGIDLPEGRRGARGLRAPAVA